MGILVTDHPRVAVQGIDQRSGFLYTERMIASGTNVVAATYPGHGGEWFLGKPIFDTMQNAVSATDANVSIIFSEPAQAIDAIYEAIDAAIDLIVCTTQGLPLRDIVRVREYIRNTPSRLIGPNSPGFLVPGLGTIGVIPEEIGIEGSIAIVSRSTVLAFEAAQMLTLAGYGQSMVIGTGAGQVVGTNFTDLLQKFETDPDTTEIVMLGGIGGYQEIDTIDFIQSTMTKPIIAYIAGAGFPTDTILPHMGDTTRNPTTALKVTALESAGVRIVNSLEGIVPVIQSIRN